jgi:hypothetical protein
MKICATIVAGLLALAVTSCSSGSEATPPPGSTSATTTAMSSSAAAKKCTDFATSTYIGLSADHANDVKAIGWYVSYFNLDVPGARDTADPTKATIMAVEKKEFGCVAEFSIRVPPTSSVAPPSSSVPSGPLTTVTDGTYLVGTDMEAGSYKSTGGQDCYWSRMKDDSGRNIIANNLGDGPARFTAKKGEYVQISRCTFTKT